MLKRFLYIALVFLVGCIDPVDVDLSTQQKHLVVEAYFTNIAKLNYVRLSYSQPHSVPYNLFEENASVYITSDQGEAYSFYYDKAGFYYPTAGGDAFGVPGRTYTLHIMAGNKLYQSEPVKMREALPIDAIHFEVDEQTYAFYGEREKQLLPGYNVLIDYQDPADEKNYLRWSFETQYEVRTQPWDYIHPFTGLPAPKDCCVQCFLKDRLELLRVSDDRLTNGRNVRNLAVLFMPFEKYLNTKNKLTVYQHSITDEAYNFFRILEQQKNSTGTVFDPPPAEVKGNMKNAENESEQVIGFFDVSGVSMKEVTILRQDIDYPVGEFRYPDDCLVLPGATTERPVGW
ncbi:DUF4249 domain-containing protein [Pontibacter sp. Tf4]|uniref:DUF4249 domain-containing protein n=1 Tax=Pontibacter sp. Tf4 TaxID=2761620 RepID=UPI00162400B6|nr:DUF4249 domain-containing protein [Pontibacter sp. Tf4]MBB6611605.1 DUF4249 domain-containing protein [Pontibacter sp. Tf4]